MSWLSQARQAVAWQAAAALSLLLNSPVWAEAAPPIKRMDDETRAKVLAAIAALIILGFGMVLLTWLAARVTQRYRKGASFFRPTARPGEHDWARKPLAPTETEPNAPSSEG
jgi:hypothetical protein